MSGAIQAFNILKTFDVEQSIFINDMYGKIVSAERTSFCTHKSKKVHLSLNLFCTFLKIHLRNEFVWSDLTAIKKK